MTVQLAGSGTVSGTSETVMRAYELPKSQIDYMRSKIPVGRLGEVAENAALVCWLASEECSFSTAATFDISEGRTTY